MGRLLVGVGVGGVSLGVLLSRSLLPRINRNASTGRVSNLERNIQARALSARDDFIQMTWGNTDTSGKGALCFAVCSQVFAKLFHAISFAQCELTIKHKSSRCAILPILGRVSQFAP